MKPSVLKPIIIILVILLSIPFDSSSQSNSVLTDVRDGQEYRIGNINGTIWMLDNLNYQTDLSKQLTPNDKSKYGLADVGGRYYHYMEREILCPEGWRLPSWKDWENYLFYVADHVDSVHIETEVDEDPHHYHNNYGFDNPDFLFYDGNPLNLSPIGRFQGEDFIYNFETPFADYWTEDEHESYPGRTHAHLWEVVNVHSHEHHMNSEEPDELRRFMCRCVKE